MGPKLFILYINETGCIAVVAMTINADNTSFIISDKLDILLKLKCNMVLNDASIWFSLNFIFLISDKTKFIRFHNHQKIF